MDRLAVSFNGTDRFQLLRVLGHGGMGVVYEALDRNYGSKVALKVLPLVSPERLLRFKREFRVASGISHPNLVRLGELVRFGDHWFFTMELVHGLDLMEHVRGSIVSPAQSGPRTLAWSSEDALQPPELEPAELGRLMPSLGDELKLRSCMQKLAGALCALHEAGCVHRDIKPSNVMVSSAGRVVLLDFGLASVSAAESTLMVAGTPLYMAPEQAGNTPITPAADWYSFGVLLFELLTGTLPFRGHMYEVLSAKQGGRAPKVQSFVKAAPDDLAELCDALLALEPEHRPSGAEVLRRLGQTQPQRGSSRASGPAQPAIGREREWAELSHYLEEVRSTGRGMAVLLRGESGVGKSTLARAFMDAQPRGAGVLTFFSRCYERELVPYKAVDGLLDSIAHYLRHAPEETVDRVLPARAGVIAQVFPVLARVEALGRATLPDLTVDLREVRAWLFSALRELFTNIGNEQMVLALVDDLHWADNDSMTLLSALLREGGAPRMLLLCTQRTQGLLSPTDKVFARDVEERSLHLENLSQPAARALAERLSQERGQQVDCARLAEESGGHPLFLRELIEASASETAGGKITLDGVLSRRIALLSEPSMRVLRLLAVSGAPLEATVLREACALAGDAFTDALHELRAGSFIHAAGEIFDDRLDISHDRIRRVLRGHLAQPEVEELHRILAGALELRGDPVLSAAHWREAQRPERAAQHYASAGKLALDALAFGDAASHYRAALSLGQWDDQERARLLAALGDALANAGKGAEAAQQYRMAAGAALGSHAVELKRRAAEELVQSGYLDEGFKVAREVLSDADLTPARSPLAALLYQRTLLRLRGLRFQERSPDQLSAKELARIDLCWSMSSGLVLTDTFQGAYFHARGLALSLRSGDLYRVARSIAFEGAYNASRGPNEKKRSDDLLALADELAERTKEPRATGTVLLMRGIAAHLQGMFEEGRTLLHRASATFREQCTGMFWERDAARQFWMESVFYLGDLQALRAAALSGLQEAKERGAIYTATNLRSGLANAIWLVDDLPDDAQVNLSEAMTRWSVQGFHVQHWYALIAEAHIALYRGEGERALTLVEAGWAELSRSHLLRVNHTRIVALHLRARAALAAAVQGDPSQRHERIDSARRAARTLRRKEAGWGQLLAELIELSAQRVEGKTIDNQQIVELAARLESGHLRVYALALRAAGLAQTAALQAEGVKAPHKVAQLLVPGWA